MKENTKRNRSIYFLLASFIIFLLLMVFGLDGFQLIEKMNLEAEKNAEKNSKLPESDLLSDSQKSSINKEGDNPRFLENDFCDDPVSMLMDRTTEYGPLYSLTYDLVNHRNFNTIEVSGCYMQKNDTISKASIVLVILDEKKEKLFRKSCKLPNGIKNQWRKNVCRFEVGNIPARERIVIKAYVWNQGKEQFLIGNYNISFTSK